MSEFIKKINLMIDPIDTCPNCRSHRSIELYEYFNDPVGYRKIADQYMAGAHCMEFNTRTPFYTFRCIKCGKAFPILWDRGFPIPDANPLNSQIFLSAFKELTDTEQRKKRELMRKRESL